MTDLLPLVLSAHPSAWCASDGDEGQERSPDIPCRFCGWQAPGWHAWYHLNGDHADAAPGNRVVACVLCHLAQHLDRPHIAREAAIVWLPEMSQAAVIALARRIHLALAAADEPPDLSRRPHRADPPVIAAFSAYKALLSRQAVVEDRLGSADPAMLGAALLTLARDPLGVGIEPDGIRLVPLGRLFKDGRDIYPELLKSASPSPRRSD